MQKEARNRYDNEFLRTWFKQHFVLAHSDPRYTEATDHGIRLDFYEWVEWKNRQKEAEEDDFQKLVAEGRACEHCHMKFTEAPLDGSCPVCKTTLKMAIDDEVQSYLDEAGLTREEF